MQCENEPGGPACKLGVQVAKQGRDMETIKQTLAEYRGREQRDRLVLKVIGVVLSLCMLGLGVATFIKRESSSSTEAAIVEQLRSLRTELSRQSRFPERPTE